MIFHSKCALALKQGTSTVEGSMNRQFLSFLCLLHIIAIVSIFKQIFIYLTSAVTYFRVSGPSAGGP